MQTPERVIGGTFAVLLTLTATAAAQGSAAWQVNRGNNFVAASICQSGSDRHCVRLQCLTMEGGGVSWGIDAPKPGYSAESTTVTWTIDGTAVSLPMNKAGPADNGVQSYDAAFSQTDHQNLVQLLKNGNRLTVGSDQFAAFSLSLYGSGTALTTLLAECMAEKNALAVDPAATELAVTADQLPQPVRSTINDIAAMCGNAFVTEGRSPEALVADDIDGDGTYDFLLDHAQFCPDAILTMCGASHCPMTLFVSDKGAWQRFDFILQGYKEFTAQGFLFQCDDPAQKAGVFMESGKLTQRNCQ